ncbi:MAG: D-alanyl-D-alanine carboxypeptidase [Rhodobacteraceae bacterium]|nr:D-alanyl-D-alanine carboxypeptidase [Paracoccaceae bacterium]
MAFVLFAGALAPLTGKAAPYAAMVVDARTGEVLHSRNADTRLHPASLTKMMTLYIAFQAVQRGEISLDTEVRITAAAANEPPSRLGLRAGQTIRLRYLLRAAAVKSANDAATAIGIAISGSEEAFARRMNATAQAMGMTNTTFLNMNGLTQTGHMSTARDMTLLGRHVIYDFPQYYNLFSRRTADAGIATVRHTNRRFLDAYRGADGIKTGYTVAAGFNLVASAERGNQRIIATMFGGTSTAQRNARVTELMDMGFERAPINATLRRPSPPPAVTTAPPANSNEAPRPGASGHTIRLSGLVTHSLRPHSRPVPGAAAPVDPDLIAGALAQVLQGLPASADDDAALSGAEAEPAPPQEVIMTAEAIAPAQTPLAAPEIVTRLSSSGGSNWGINVGRYPSRNAAERVLLRVALNEATTLDGAERRVNPRSNGFDANFTGLTRESADLACRRLQARGTLCFMIGSD